MVCIKGNFYPLLKLAIPISLTSLLGSAIFFFHTLFLARLGADILAAGALASYLTGTIMVLSYGVLSAINVLVAHQHGANNQRAISLIMRDGMGLALLLVLPTFLLLWNISPIFLLLGQNKSVVALATSYLHAWAWGLLPQFMMAAIVELMIGLGQMRVILVVTGFGVALSLFFSFVLIFGYLGFPMLGVAGAGLGLAIVNWLLLGGMIAFLWKRPRFSSYFHDLFKWVKPFYLMEMIHIGFPMGLMYCIEVGFFFALTLLMGTFGADFLAANQIVMQYNGIFITIIFAIAQAVTVRMGYLIGAGDLISAKDVGYVGVYMSGLLMLVAALVFWFFPSWLIALDFDIHQSKNRMIVHYATQFLAICAIFQFFEACRISFFGALRALKDTRFTLLNSIVSFWLIALPMGYCFATYLDMGAIGLWWGMPIGAILSVILLAWRYHFKMNSRLSQNKMG